MNAEAAYGGIVLNDDPEATRSDAFVEPLRLFDARRHAFGSVKHIRKSVLEDACKRRVIFLCGTFEGEHGYLVAVECVKIKRTLTIS